MAVAELHADEASFHRFHTVDLPGRIDCGMGGHATNCPAIVMTICLSTGGPEAGPHRSSVLMAWVPPEAGHHRGGRHDNDVLRDGEDGQVEHLGQRRGG